MEFQTVNPATEEVIQTWSRHSAAQVDDIVASVSRALESWRDTNIDVRCAFLRKLSVALISEKETLAKLITQEMGKPITDALAEVEKCAAVCDFYAQNARRFLADEPVETEACSAFVSFEALGVICAVMPWNFPFWQVFRFAAPALAAGNVCILKHASNTTACALAIEKIFILAGLPENIFRTVLLDHEQLGKLLARREIAAVTLTGSTDAGRKVAAAAGKALKKTVLELGGSDAYLVLEDANIEEAARICCKSRLINGGQSCISAKRFIVVGAVRREFEDAFVAEMQKVHSGDPSDKDCKLGPLARSDLRKTLHKQVQQSLAAGARALLGGSLSEGKGYHYEPCVLTDVGPRCSAFHEELFGPVAAIIPVSNEDTAIKTANQSVYGLGSAVFSQDPERGKRIARQLQVGTCFINDFVRSDPRLPFGGIKDSGYGRELSHFGIREFVNIKSVWLN